MYYLRFTKVIIHHFISKDKSISMRNKIFMHTVRDDSILGTLRFVSKSNEYQVYGALLPERMSNQQMRDSRTCKTYLAFTIGAATPKKARKFKKPTSLSNKKTLKKAPVKTKRSKGIELLSDVALLEEAQLEKAIKQRRRETHIHQAGGSSEGANLESEGSDELKGKSIDTSEGTGLIPGVLDVSKADSYETADINKTDDEEEDEFIHTPEDYVPTDDKHVDDEEFERINKEMYSDVNVEWKDSEREGEGKDDEEMTDAEHENVSQEAVGDQVKGDAQATVTAILLHKRLKFHYKVLLSHPTMPPNFSTLITFPRIRTLFETMTKTKSFERNSKHKARYHDLMESILEDEDAMDKGVADKLKKRKLDDTDRDEGPPARPDQGLKRKKMWKKLNHQRRLSQLELPNAPPSLNQTQLASNTDEAPVFNVDLKDWFKKPKRPPTLEPEWNE
ncbi:hypothetical protein Tco_1100764, partial [Tanacetum coccineum]